MNLYIFFIFRRTPAPLPAIIWIRPLLLQIFSESPEIRSLFWTQVGLWLVEPDHVTWILASDWLMIVKSSGTGRRWVLLSPPAEKFESVYSVYIAASLYNSIYVSTLTQRKSFLPLSNYFVCISNFICSKYFCWRISRAESTLVSTAREDDWQ